jgi:methylmalonyl-CoA/ethylmalonyl-CoA epimerase
MTVGRLHHVGFVVAKIHAEIGGFQSSLGASWDGRVFHDPLQKVHVTFLSTSNPSDAQIELVEPAADDSPVTKFLQKGGGLHHLCYEVPALDAALAQARAQKSIIVKRPQPAVAFEGRRIAWILTPQKLLVELLESADV